ncbi:MAG: Rid family detoxifying hydrolase [Bacteriovoracaceae bacterium]|nr:Rid family detoxifying hydrolase [Bacteriovoracaceae bacterium]
MTFLEPIGLPPAVGPYSHAIKHDNTIFLSGQIGIDPLTQKLGETLEEQLNQILKNMNDFLQHHKLQRKQIVKSSIFVTDLAFFSKVNIAYENFFTAPYPVRSTIQVSALPKNALIEIEFLIST